MPGLFYLANCLQVSSMLEHVSELHSFYWLIYFHPVGRTNLFICLSPPLWAQEYSGKPFLHLVSMIGAFRRYLCRPCTSSGVPFHFTEVFCCDRSLTARTRHNEFREKIRSAPISQTCSCSVPRHAHPGPCPWCLPEWLGPKTFLVLPMWGLSPLLDSGGRLWPVIHSSSPLLGPAPHSEDITTERASGLAVHCPYESLLNPFIERKLMLKQWKHSTERVYCPGWCEKAIHYCLIIFVWIINEVGHFFHMPISHLQGCPPLYFVCVV